MLTAFGWAESFPGNARISPKLQVDSHAITLHRCFIQAKESHPGLQRVVCPHFSLKSEQDPPFLQGFMWRWWDILADNVWPAQHLPFDDKTPNFLLLHVFWQAFLLGWNFGLELFKLWSRAENDPFWAVGKLWRGESRAEAGPGTGK